MPLSDFLTWITGPDGGQIAAGALVGALAAWMAAMRSCNSRLTGLQDQVEELADEITRLRQEVMRWQTKADGANADLVNQLRGRIDQLEEAARH